MPNKTLKGIALASCAGVCWGSMGVAAQYLMAECQFRVIDLTSIRLFGAGIILVLLDVVLHGTQHAKAVFSKENLLGIIIYGLILLGSQFTFFQSIAYANAATATILVLTSPLFVIIYLALSCHRRIKLIEIISLVLAMFGVVLLVTKGNLNSIDLSILGVVWGLVSAIFASMGTIQPVKLVRRLTVFPVIGWAMTLSGFAACLYNNPFDTNVLWNSTSMLCYAHVVVCGTIVSFCCYLKSMEFIPPSTASMLVCFEPLSAVLLSFLLLGMTFTLLEAVGALCILCTALLLARSKT